ncbi:MAG: TIGR02757 family protein [Bacteroidales bacterium]|nr:TIGR02757 family protein [Bacteroidales bacterium]
MNFTHQQLHQLLEEKSAFYNNPDFIEKDPISIPHLFTKKEDIEIAGFLAATLAWGQRVTIINKSRELMSRMDNSPFEFVMKASEKEIQALSTFVHRTFQGEDCMYFIYALQQIYLHHGGLEATFSAGYHVNQSIKESITGFREVFFSFEHLRRTRKHVPDPQTGSAAKRVNMFLRWMVRDDNKGVDFGIWKNFKTSDLLCPLDLHSGNVARKLGLLDRKQDDWQAVEKLTANLRLFDPLDPVKYDFALFGTGVNEN